MRKVAYGRVIYVEPNDMVASTSGSISLDNVTWDPEDINMSVDLQVIVPRRSDFGSYTDGSGNKSRVEIWHEGMSDVDRYISFMQGSDIKNNNGTLVGHELTTDYINASYSEITSQGQSCKEALGIDSIDITFDQHFYPRVSIRFIDVRGYSLMMPTDEVYRLEHTNGGVKGGYINFFRALFHYPYPRFLLTVKGFYGSSVTFQLAVDEFKNNFNSDTGNFEITVSFIGYMYGLYTDVPFNLLISAPYYNPKEVSQTAGTYSSWGGPNFVYDNGDGNVGRPIYTFVEFLEQCNKLNDAIAKTKNNSSQYTNLGTANKNSVKITALGELKKKLKNYIDETRKLNKRTNDKSYIVENEGYDVIFFQVSDTTTETTTSGSTEEDKSFFGFDINTKKAAEWWSENMANNKIKVAITQWNAFAKAWDDYNKEDNIGIPKWQPGGTLSKDNVYYSDVKEEEQTYYEPFYKNRKVNDKGAITADKNSTSGGGITIDYLIKHDPSLRDKILKSEYATRPVYYLMGSVIAKIIDDKINELRSEQEEIQPIAKSELESLYKDNLGFNPSVLNMYRMIFAHLSCFMNLFYDTIKKIKNNEDSRRLANFGVTKDKIDVSSYMSENAIVPPFPAIFKTDESENNRRVQIYPGEIPELVKKMPELELVEGLINGTLGLKDRVRQIICDTHEKVTFNQESEMAAKDTDYNYTPTAISDFMHESNPYVSVLSGSAYDLMVCMMSRMVSASLQLYMSDTDPSTSLSNIGEIECRNFVKLHPESSGGSKLKQDLLSMSDGFKQNETDVFNKFIRYWNAQGLNGAKYEDGYLSFNIENAPIYSEGYPPFKQTSVLVGSDGYVPLNGANSGKVFFTERRAVNGFDNINKFIEKIKEQQKLENQGETGLSETYGNLTNGTTGIRMLRLTTTPAEMNMLSGTFQKKDKINRIPDVLNITYSPAQYSKDAYYAFHDKKDGKFVFPFHDFTNENGDIFFSKQYKNNLDDYEKAGLFLMYLNANAFGYYNSDYKIQNSNTDVLIPDLANTSICAARYGAICLLGYTLWKDIDSTVITSPVPTCSLHFEFCNEKSRIDKKEYNETKYKRIYNNTELKKKIIGIFEEFVKSSSWKNIYTSLSNRENYKKGDDGNIATSPYCLSYKQKEIIYDEMLSEDTDIAIYVINNESKYKNSAAIKIPKQRFIYAVDFMVTHYGGIETEYERTDPNFGKSDVSNAHRLALYNSLKNLYDKWGNSYNYSDFILRGPDEDRKKKQDRFEKGIAIKDGCEFDNFIFVDCYYNDISDKYRMNPSILSDIIAKQVQAEANGSMMECMADMMQKNHMLFLALPVYSNFYKFETIHNMFMPKPEETMLTGIGATYVGMYTYEVSHVVEDDRFEDHLDGDYLMIADLNGIDDDPRPTEIGQQVFSYGGKGLSIPVPAFGVTYARQNQGYFKKIDVNMDNPRVTDYSLYNLYALTNSVNGNELNKPLTVANDIYSIYANRSYNCSVEMMGCANIMPMMYFQLNNIPMFRGAYMISNVEHHISAGNFTTKFSGVRICKNQLPYVQDLFDCNNNFNFEGFGLTESPYTYDCAEAPFPDVKSDFTGAGPGKEAIPPGFPSDKLLFEFITQAEGKQGIQWVGTYKGHDVVKDAACFGYDFPGGVHNPAYINLLGLTKEDAARLEVTNKPRKPIGAESYGGKVQWGWETKPIPTSDPYWKKLIPYYRDAMIWAWKQPGIQAIKCPALKLARMHTINWYGTHYMKGLTHNDQGWWHRLQVAAKVCGSTLSANNAQTRDYASLNNVSYSGLNMYDASSIPPGAFYGKSRAACRRMAGITDTSMTAKQVQAAGLIVNVTFNQSSGKRTLKMNKYIAEDFKQICNEILALGNFKLDVGNCFRPKDTISGSEVSRHCWGVAVDINAGGSGNPWFAATEGFPKTESGNLMIPKNQPELAKGSKAPWGIKMYPYNGGYDSSKCIWHWGHPVVQIFLRHGWGWGGAYGDVMHFSIDDGH